MGKNRVSIITGNPASNKEAGTALIIVSLSITVLLALFFLCFEVFLMLRSSIQANRDIRNSAFGAASSYMKSIERVNGVDSPLIRTQASSLASNIYSSSTSNRTMHGGVDLSFKYANGDPLPSGQVCTNWTLDGTNIRHKYLGYQKVINLAAHSPNQSGTDTLIAYRSKVVYDGTLGNKGLFPIVVKQ